MHSRAERAAEALALRGEGLVYREIGERMGVSTSYARGLVCDPDGSAVRARKDSYRGRCVDCGTPTNGSGGRANAPKRCNACRGAHDLYWTPERIVEAIQLWAEEHDGPPKAHDWLHTTTGIGLGIPPVNIVQRRFGSWTAAIEAAGFPCPEIGQYDRAHLKVPQAKVERVAAMYRSGLSLKERAERLGLGSSTVVRYLDMAGVPRRPARRSE